MSEIALNKGGLKFCYHCKFEGETAALNCPRCHRLMQSSRQIRILGALLMFIGVFLLGLMGFVINYTNNAIKNSDRYDSTVQWNASPEETQIMYAILYLVSAFGFAAFVAGLWHLITGKRNLFVIGVMLGLGVILFVIAAIVPEIF